MFFAPSDSWVNGFLGTPQQSEEIKAPVENTECKANKTTIYNKY